MPNHNQFMTHSCAQHSNNNNNHHLIKNNEKLSNKKKLNDEQLNQKFKKRKNNEMYLENSIIRKLHINLFESTNLHWFQ